MSVTHDVLKLVIGVCVMTLPGFLQEFSDTFRYIAQWLRRCAALLVALSRDRFPVLSLDSSVTYFLPTVPCPGVDSASSENEYQEHFWG
jgi:hypothetical protein